MTNTITSLFALYLIGNLTCLIYLHSLLISFLRVILCCSYPHFNCFHELLLILFNYLMLIRLFITSFMIISWWFFFLIFYVDIELCEGKRKEENEDRKKLELVFLGTVALIYCHPALVHIFPPTVVNICLPKLDTL